MKIYFSKFFNDYVFVIGGQSYFFFTSTLYPDAVCLVPIFAGHIKNSRMHKNKKDKEVLFICTVKD